jgi:NAD(P)-dependent dehydrogenase (short-subunit alcohol dehydrogenase family)
MSSVYRNIPPQDVDPSKYMFEPGLGKAPGLGRMAGRRVLVVGAGQRESSDETPPIGNGRAIARLLGREGASVVCLDVNREAAELTERDIKAEGGIAYSLVADVSDVHAIEQAVSGSVELMGGLDGLVLNVGIASEPLARVTAEEWDKVFAINVRSHLWFAKTALEIMEPGSSMVMISSRAGMRPGARMPAYEASKAAQYQLARTIALEGEPKAIRCNCVVVGPIDTPMGRDEQRKRPNRASSVAFGRQGTGWEIAYPTLFMLSRESSYVNAQSLVVDGGQFFGVARAS